MFLEWLDWIGFLYLCIVQNHGSDPRYSPLSSAYRTKVMRYYSCVHLAKSIFHDIHKSLSYPG